MKNFIKPLLLGVALSVLCKSIYADDPPIRTFYLTERDPATFFNYGIISPGVNYNLLEDLTGNSVSAQTTGYVASSTNESFILYRILWLLQHRSGDEPNEYWVNSIRPSLTFYNVERSVRTSAEAVRYTDPVLYQRLEQLDLMLISSRISMWVTRGTIVPSQIESASLYRLINNRITRVETRYNPNYVPTDPTVNPNNIMINGSEDQNIYYSSLGPFLTLPGAFCQSFSSQQNLWKTNVNANTCIKHTYKEFQSRLARSVILLSDMD